MDTPTQLVIALIDDHPAILSAVIHELSAALGISSTLTARHVAEVLGTPGPYDVVVLDLQLADGTDPADNVRRLAERGWPVLLYTQEVNARLVARCFAAGASGIVGKGQELEDLVDAIRVVTAGEPYLSSDWAAALVSAADSIPALTPRERQALALYATGLTQDAVARRMHISADTLKEHLKHLRTRYAGVGRPAPDKIDLYKRAVEDGYVPPPTSPS